MRHVSILIPNGQFSIVNIAGAFQILEAANGMNVKRKGQELFELEFASTGRPSKDVLGLYTVNPTKLIGEIKNTDLIIVPAVHASIDIVLENNRDIIEWILDHYKKGAEVASFCIGIYMVAETGILDGKICSTHWAHAAKLKARFPKLKVKDENFITEDDGIYTSGGAYAFTNLILYLIEKFGGRTLAIEVAKNFMIDIDKGTQSTFSIFNGQKNHKDSLVLKVQNFIETNFENKFTVDELASDHSIVRRTLERRFKKATGNSINEYLQRVRVEAAKKQLEQDRKTINEVMFDVGDNDGKAFRDVFRKHAGLTPIEYRQKYDNTSIAFSRNQN